MNTPTPWRISKKDEFRILDTKNGKLVADASGNIDMTDDEAENNAALIVRAVNSHQSLIDALDKLTEFATEGVAVPESWDVILNARAALALAKEPT